MRLRNFSSVILTLLLTSVTLAQSKTLFPDIPDNHWVYENILRLKNGGLLTGFPDGLVYHAQPITRTYFASAVNTSFTMLKSLTLAAESEARQPGFMSTGPAADESLKIAFSEIAILQDEVAFYEESFPKLMKVFTPELTNLGVNVPGTLHDIRAVCSHIRRLQVSQPGSALVQFEDVPPSHWAAKQVLELRQLGIIQGYPHSKRFDH